MSQSSVLSMLRERAGLQPDAVAYAFTDYEKDQAGVSESLTWSQTYRRTLNVAHELGQHGLAGDRALILAPQGLDYTTAFLGSMEAGYISVPLSVPQIGSHDERVSAVLADTSPSVILTTSGVAPSVTEYLAEVRADARPTIVEVDGLDLEARVSPAGRSKDAPSIAYLQYTSGSTRAPAGVMISDRNLLANFGQLMGDFFPDLGGVAPSDATIVGIVDHWHVP